MPKIKQILFVCALCLFALPIQSAEKQKSAAKTTSKTTAAKLANKQSAPKAANPKAAIAAEPVKQLIKIVYFSQQQRPPIALSNLDPFIQNKGLPGAELAIADNNTTGQFTRQHYELKPIIAPLDADIIALFKQQIAADDHLILLNLPAASLLKIADLPETQQKLLFDTGSRDDALRGEQCRKQVFHVLPSRTMRADALAQYLLKKRWTKWFLVTGTAPEDQLFATSLKHAAKRFGLKIVAEKTWTGASDVRRIAQADVPTFTQVEDYDVLVVADEQGLFGEYLDYRTWLPRPVVGTQGLVATAWHPSHEQWGAIQLQNRFQAQYQRWMQEEDYGVYLAVRAIGEASVRTKSNQVQAIGDYLLGDGFALQGYKGRPLSFRQWDRQLRQPILLAAPRSLVAVAPVDGFLHPKTELDTLGYDMPESTCRLNLPH